MQRAIEFWREWYRKPVTQRLQDEIEALEQNHQGIHEDSSVKMVIEIKKNHISRVRSAAYYYPEESKKRW